MISTIYGLSFLLATFPVQQPIPNITLSSEELQRRVELAGNHPEKLLRLRPLTSPEDAKALLKKIRTLLVTQNEQLPAKQWQELEKVLARMFPQCLSTPQEVEYLLGAPETKSRQILYNSYREQWRYNRPLSVVLTFSCSRGGSPQLLDAHPLP